VTVIARLRGSKFRTENEALSPEVEALPEFITSPPRPTMHPAHCPSSPGSLHARKHSPSTPGFQS
jgi:hypothetical protein